MSAKMHQMRKPRDRENVRVGGLEKTLEAFNDELGQKVAQSLVAFDGMQVKPLRERIWALEHPFRSRGKRLWAFLTGLVARIKILSEAASGRTGEPQSVTLPTDQPGVSGPGEADPSPVLTEGRDKE